MLSHALEKAVEAPVRLPKVKYDVWGVVFSDTNESPLIKASSKFIQIIQSNPVISERKVQHFESVISGILI